MFKTLVSTFSSYVEHKKEWNQFSAIYIQVPNTTTTTKSVDYTSLQ